MKYKLKHVVEYALIRAAAALIQHLPYRLALALGWAGAWFGFYVLRLRVTKTRSRIREVFGDRFTPREIDGIAWRSLRNFVFSAVDALRIPVSSTKWMLSVINEHGHSKTILEHLKTGKGAIIATMHMGSWEIAAVTCRVYDVPLFTVAAKQKNPLVDAYLNQLRRDTGFETIPRDTSILRGIIRRLKAGKVFAILPDVRFRTPALSIRFLGKTVNIAAGMGYLAWQTGVPIFPVVITRIGWTRHDYRMDPPIWPDLDKDKRAEGLRITQAVFDFFDKNVREYPDQWFWFNKRWILDPLLKKENKDKQL